MPAPNTLGQAKAGPTGTCRTPPISVQASQLPRPCTSGQTSGRLTCQLLAAET